LLPGTGPGIGTATAGATGAPTATVTTTMATATISHAVWTRPGSRGEGGAPQGSTGTGAPVPRISSLPSGFTAVVGNNATGGGHNSEWSVNGDIDEGRKWEAKR